MFKPVLLGLTILTLSGAASAHDARLLQLLSAIDQVPTAAALRGVSARPLDALLEVTRDSQQSLYVRERALTIVSVVPGPGARVALQELAQRLTEPSLRWAAAYTALRAFGPTEPAALDFGRAWLRSADPNDRDAAIRGLSWIPGATAQGLLNTALTQEPDAELRDVIRHVLARRAAR